MLVAGWSRQPTAFLCLLLSDNQTSPCDGEDCENGDVLPLQGEVPAQRVEGARGYSKPSEKCSPCERGGRLCCSAGGPLRLAWLGTSPCDGEDSCWSRVGAASRQPSCAFCSATTKPPPVRGRTARMVMSSPFRGRWPRSGRRGPEGTRSPLRSGRRVSAVAGCVVRVGGPLRLAWLGTSPCEGEDSCWSRVGSRPLSRASSAGGVRNRRLCCSAGGPLRLAWLGTSPCEGEDSGWSGWEPPAFLCHFDWRCAIAGCVLPLGASSASRCSAPPPVRGRTLAGRGWGAASLLVPAGCWLLAAGRWPLEARTGTTLWRALPPGVLLRPLHRPHQIQQLPRLRHIVHPERPRSTLKRRRHCRQ